MKIIKNEFIPNIVISNNGLIDAKDLNNGDIIYEYKTSRPIKVIGTKKSKVDKIYQCDYSDGRIQYFREHELVWDGKKLAQVKLHGRYNKFNHIRSSEVYFLSKSLMEVFEPDSYTAGMLFMYGDFTDDYVNIVYNGPSDLSNICYKYNLYSYKCGNRIYFAKGLENISINNSNRIMWKDFYPDIDRDNIVIPDKYLYSSYNERIKFVRGIFDIAHESGMMEHYNGIKVFSPDMSRLESFQTLLWSLGIDSVLHYDPELNRDTEQVIERYSLSLLNEYKTEPSLFYNTDAIKDMIRLRDNKMYHEPLYEVKVNNIECIGTGYRYDPICEIRSRLYITENYLPLLSY
jgi:hypothetical protein